MGSVKSDVYALRPLHVLGNWLAIIPKITPNNELFIRTGCFHLYPTVMTIVYILMFGLLTYGRIIYLSKLLENTVFLVNIASDCSLVAATICSIIGVNMINGGKLLKFLLLMKNVDDDFKEVVVEDKHSNRSVYVELFLLHGYCLINYIYSAYLWTNSVGFGVYQYYSVRDLFTYHTFVLALIIRHYALAINYRFEKVNLMMKRLSRKYVFTGDELPMHDWNVKRLACIYSKLTECVKNYNSIFGVHFVTLYICIVVNLLAPINTALVYGNGRTDFNGTTFGSGLIVLCIIWLILPLILGSAMFLACDKCTKQAAETPSVCFMLIQELSNAEKDLPLKDELRDFVHQARTETAEFSAAGLFNVNLFILFSLFGSVTSYLIVLIQFH